MNKTGVFTLNGESVKSALVTVILMAVLGVAGYVVGVGDVFALDYHALVNVAVMSFLAGLVSLIKNFLTSDSGKFANITKIQ